MHITLSTPHGEIVAPSASCHLTVSPVGQVPIGRLLALWKTGCLLVGEQGPRRPVERRWRGPVVSTTY
jgi:hypothetical protein